jgi:uncharacterized protein (TIGR03435 family)
MTEADDIELLRQYAVENSETAFAAIVGRHVNLVYSVALRRVGNPHAAEEITQAVFIILSRKAKSFSHKTILTGWLHQTTRLMAANFLRTEIRRQHREQEAFMQSASSETETWTQIAPLLDDAIAKLGARDRDAILLRYFENKSAREMAAALRVDEPAAQKRLTRAVEKLRAFFAKRGVTLTAAAIAGAVSSNSVHAAPVGLAATVTAAAAKGAAVSASTLTLIKGALKIMAWTKMKMAILAGTGLVLAAGTTIAVEEIQRHTDENYPWQVESPTSDMLNKIPPLVKIVPTKFPNKKTSIEVTRGPSSLGIGVRIQDILVAAYDAEGYFYGRKRFRMLLLTKISPARYDYIVNLKFSNVEAMQQELAKQSSGNVEALQLELKNQFGLVGRRETIVTNVLLLKVKNPNSPGLEPITAENQAPLNQKAGEISFQDQQGLQTLAGALANDFRMPVLDETGLTNHYYYDLKWNPFGGQQQNQLNLKQALIDQLGLEVVQSRAPIEFLVVEKVKN